MRRFPNRASLSERTSRSAPVGSETGTEGIDLPFGKLLALSKDDGHLQSWQLPEMTPGATVTLPVIPDSMVSLNNMANEFLLVCSKSMYLRKWWGDQCTATYRSGRRIVGASVEPATGTGVVRFAACTESGKVTVWEETNPKPSLTFRLGSDREEVTQVRFLDEMCLLVVCPNEIVLLDLEKSQTGLRAGDACAARLDAGLSSTMAVETGMRVALGGEGGAIVFDAELHMVSRPVSWRSVTSLLFRDRVSLVCGQADGLIEMWNVREESPSRPLWSTKRDAAIVNMVILSPKCFAGLTIAGGFVFCTFFGEIMKTLPTQTSLGCMVFFRGAMTEEEESCFGDVPPTVLPVAHEASERTVEVIPSPTKSRRRQQPFPDVVEEERKGGASAVSVSPSAPAAPAPVDAKVEKKEEPESGAADDVEEGSEGAEIVLLENEFLCEYESADHVIAVTSDTIALRPVGSAEDEWKIVLSFATIVHSFISNVRDGTRIEFLVFSPESRSPETRKVSVTFPSEFDDFRELFTRELVAFMREAVVFDDS